MRNDTADLSASDRNYDGYFGLCPHCHGCDGCVNIGKSHWFICDKHKTMWCVGSNLFSSWRGQTEEEQRRTYYARGIDAYEEVVPVLPDRFIEGSAVWQKERADRYAELKAQMRLWGLDHIRLGPDATIETKPGSGCFVAVRLEQEDGKPTLVVDYNDRVVVDASGQFLGVPVEDDLPF